ncbi:hypothetical protein LCGC14_2718400, partial [marine sediment metagenome]
MPPQTINGENVQSLKSWMAGWNKKTKAKVVFDPDDKILIPEGIHLGIPAVDNMLGDGFPRGRTTIFLGEASSGKTLLAQLLIAAAQREGGTCMFFDIERCLTAGHKILTTDLRWIPVENLSEGDSIIGFEEYPNGRNRQREWRQGKVLSNRPFETSVWKIYLKDGTTLECTGNHKWLTYYKPASTSSG